MAEDTTRERLARRRRLVRRDEDYRWEDRPFNDRTLRNFHDRLDEACDLATDVGPVVDPTEHEDWIEHIRFAETVGAEKLDAVVRLYELLDEIERGLPEVEGWCVLKVYRDGFGVGPRVWCATTTREQAEEFAPAIERHYASKDGRTYDPENGKHDRFVVAWGSARALDYVRPGLTAAEYVRGLG